MTEPSVSGQNGNLDNIAATSEQPGKKRKKVRSVWIAFVGRVVAQFVGSAATIGLGLMLLYKYEPVPHGHMATVAPVVAASPPASVRPASPPDDLSLAVLPLVNFSSDDRQQYVADSMTEVLTTDLAQIPWLHVVSRTTATSPAAQQRTMTDIAASLGVRYILEGSVAQANGRMRITAQLIDALRDEHVWAQRYDRPAQNVFAAQEEVAAAVVRDVSGALAHDEGDTPFPTSGR